MNLWHSLGFVLAYMCVWFAISLIKKRNDVADTAWGLGFVLLAWVSFVFSSGKNNAALLINILVTIWGLRLAYHIHKRNYNKPEDARYQQWRAQWKYFYTRSFFQVFTLQGILLWLISWPITYINFHSYYRLMDVSWLGLLIWLVGFGFESIGDAELKQFIANPTNKGKLMTGGLWKYSRHPNYFGEVMQWWGIFVMALSVTNEWVLIVSPLTITILIVFVSGIPMTEKRYAGRPDWEEYKRRTSPLIPWFSTK